jgi:DNA-binding MarR family transcriptional regulator
MAEVLDVEEVAGAIRASTGMLLRRLRQVRVEGELSMPENSALARLERCGPVTSSELARMEQISAQSMGATLGALEASGLVQRQADPQDGRRALLSVTDAGRQRLRDKRSARTQQLAQAMQTGFTPDELKLLMDAAPLLERLAQSI